MAGVRSARIGRVIDRLTGWFPAVLLAGLAMLTYWLDAQVRQDWAPRPDRPDPDYYVEEFAATRFGTDGSVVERLVAKRLDHFATGRPTELVAPELTDTLPGQPRLNVRADAAKVSIDGEHVYLSGNVVAVRDADARQSRMTLNTESLHVMPKAQKADTQQRVVLKDGTGTHVGGAMTLDNRARTLRLSGGVTGELQPSLRK